jgi:hypothetical protein
MTERNKYDERADRRVFEPAIARLREELANFERQASATRALIEALVVRAELADPTRARIATAKARSRGRHQSSRPTSNTQKRTPAPTMRHVPTNTTAAVGSEGAKELAKIVAAVARSQRDAEAAIRSKDGARLKTAVAAIARAERQGGEILIKLGGGFKPLPVSQADRKRWREAAARSPKAFAVKLRHDVAKAQAQINGTGANLAAADKAKPAPARPAKQVKPPSALTAPHLQAKLSTWHREPDGSLSRTLTTVAKDDAAAAPAGAA